MVRRFKSKEPIKLLLLGLFLIAVCIFGEGHAGEFRGLWVDAFGSGFLDKAEVVELAKTCRKFNFNAIFVEIRCRGDAFYVPKLPNLDVRSERIAPNFDALAELITECHSNYPPIEVHAWMVTHFVWSSPKHPDSPSHVVNQHPEFLTQDSIGQRIIEKGYFLDPGNPDANLSIYRAAKDLVSRYDIDGLHWDYCRYPTRDSGYNQVAVKRFNEEFRRVGTPSPNDPIFASWRRRQVTDFLRWANADLLEIKPRMAISAAVFANLNDAFGYRFQDWSQWLREGIVDFCVPMNFSADNQNVFFPRADVAFSNQFSRYIFTGQAAYMNSPDNTVAQLSYSREKGFFGTVVYCYRSPLIAAQSLTDPRADRESVFTILRESFQPDWTMPPKLPWKKTRGILKGLVASGNNDNPIYDAKIVCQPEPSLQRSRLPSKEDIKEVRTEPHGIFALFDLAPGAYLIRATSTNGEIQTKNVTVQAGLVSTADFLFQQARTNQPIQNSNAQKPPKQD